MDSSCDHKFLFIIRTNVFKHCIVIRRVVDHVVETTTAFAGLSVKGIGDHEDRVQGEKRFLRDKQQRSSELRTPVLISCFQ